MPQLLEQEKWKVNLELGRREFLRQSILGAAIFGASQLTDGIATGGFLARASAADANPLFRISLAQWSLNRALFGKSDFKLDHLDFAPFAMKEFGIDAVEYVNQFFKDKAEDTDYLAEMKKRADDAGVRSLLIMVDGEGLIGDPDDAARKKSFENHKKWVDAAALLGCHAVRVNAGSRGTPEEQHEYVVDGLRMLTEFAEERNLRVLVENHGGLSSNGKWLAKVISAVDHPHCGTLPDFGNFRISPEEQYDRYEGVTELMPFAMAVSAKSLDFNEAGDETTIDYPRMLKIVLDAGYHGYIGIEYEGHRLDEVDGIRKTQALLTRVRDELTKSGTTEQS
ncbi:sugar phosphate isomerase/epimerase family protein [Planctomicrobium sp. SH661]|uniref:sugar phosphate isomerase/epimerase family protein n=1 Tax=Planctomicrobium sp. SH661 TaxID=3448124 RepID=UPI003F5B20F5